jgi:hypothetical protein
MTLNSSSTLAEVQAQYLDNAAWEGDAEKAQNCLEAIRHLLIRRPFRMNSNGRNSEFESLQAEKTRLEKYISTVGTAAAAARSPFVRCRSVQI